jgi:hypothetical protein
MTGFDVLIQIMTFAGKAFLGKGYPCLCAAVSASAYGWRSNGHIFSYLSVGYLEVPA